MNARVEVHATIAPLPRVKDADYNARILWSPARFVGDTYGKDALAAIARRCGMEIADLTANSHRWISQASFEAFLEEVRRLVGSEEKYLEAAVHRFDEAYGPMRYLLWAASPADMYAACVRNYQLVSAADRLVTVAIDRTSWHMRVESDRPLSRLSCLLRQHQFIHLPRAWGLPAAEMEEKACIAHGHAACELHFRWFDSKRWLRILGFGVAGVVAGALLGRIESAGVAAGTLGLVGLLVGYVLEVRRTESVNSARREEFMGALKRIAVEEAEARREIMAFEERQRDWNRALQESTVERSAAIRDIVDRVDHLQAQREKTLRGFSHDLRSPLTVIQCGNDYFRQVVPDSETTREVLDDADHAVANMRAMLADLMQVVTDPTALVRLVPKAFDVAELVERMRRRLRALVHGRDEVQVVVSRTDQAPPTLEVDPLLLDRIIDNLFTNAAKYTQRGSIHVKVDGADSHLILEVADTGRGIAPEDIPRVFRAGGSETAARAVDSYGVGLSVVVQLLHQIGGKLEVSSNLRVGTTFRVYFPVRPSPPPPDVERNRTTSLFSRVVSVRNLTPTSGD
jgi:signal transduction histidine kinase